MTEAYIRAEIEKLIKKHGTTDPFELCALKGIQVETEYLGKLKGYFYKHNRVKIIKLNSTLDDESIKFKKFVCAHELGHSIFHSELNTMFLCKFTHFTTNKFEIQANLFAELLISLHYNNDALSC